MILDTLANAERCCLHIRKILLVPKRKPCCHQRGHALNTLDRQTYVLGRDQSAEIKVGECVAICEAPRRSLRASEAQVSHVERHREIDEWRGCLNGPIINIEGYYFSIREELPRETYFMLRLSTRKNQNTIFGTRLLAFGVTQLFSQISVLSEKFVGVFIDLDAYELFDVPSAFKQPCTRFFTM